MPEQYVTLAEVRDLLTEEHEKRELLSPQKNAMEHARAISPLSVEDTKKIAEEVRAISGMTDYAAVKVADLLPKYPEDVRAIFSKERLNADPKTIDQVLGVVSKYL